MFSGIVEYKKAQATIYRGPQGIVTVIVQAISSFP